MKPGDVYGQSVGDVHLCRYFVSLHFLSDLIRMERIKVRQQKFKRGKEKMLSIAQESGEGQTQVQPEEDDDDGMTKAARGLSLCSKCYEVL